MPDHGLDAEIGALIRAAGDAAAEEQLSLAVFDDLPSPVVEAASERGVLVRPGRPTGSKSRANLDIVRLIKATKRPTLLALKELADLPLPDFAKLLGCEVAPAFDRWLKVAELVTAYEEGRPQVKVDVTSAGERLPTVVFMDEPVRADLVAGNPPLEGQEAGTVDFTQVSDAAFEDVTDEMSQVDPQALDPAEHSAGSTDDR